MGILNCTPDSFSDGGRNFVFDDAVRHAADLIEGGAEIVGWNDQPCLRG